MQIVVVGKGNVATSLHLAFAKVKLNVEMVSSREGLEDIPQNADVYIYSVRDDALQEVVSKVHVNAHALHVHTSGALPITIFGADKPHAGVFYPLQTFSKTRPIEDFSRVPIFIEALCFDDMTVLYALAQNLTSLVYEADAHDRERLHVAGVFANNFVNQMYDVAAEMLCGTHIPFQALLPLIDETAAKIHVMTPQNAQTGPARRRDEHVMMHHMELLPNEELKTIYRLLSERIMDQHDLKE